jgi:hypothetical protein
MKHFLLITEGAHDLAALSRILKALGISNEIKKKSNLSSVWHKLIPTKFPFTEDCLDRITPVPSFYENEEYSIAIKVAGSDTRIFPVLDEVLDAMALEELNAINGIILFCDADDKKCKDQVSRIFKQTEQNNSLSIDINSFLTENVVIIKGRSIKTCIYTFPNNADCGTLEKVLLEGASIVYKDLYELSSKYVLDVGQTYKKKWGRSCENKVLVGCIANVLKPGKANQVSINDNDWICQETIDSSVNIKILFEFVKNFIEN